MSEWILILAAGESKRFNGIKALAPWKDGTFLSHAIHTAQATTSHIIVVTGAHQDALTLPLQDTNVVFNPDWANGMGRSLAVGLKAIVDQDEYASLVTVLPVDQPFVTADHLNALASRAHECGQCVLTSSNETIGPPAAIPRHMFDDVLSLSGDRGLKTVLQPDDYQTIPNASALVDIDTPAEWLRYQTDQV